ncbi:MAG: hypothetical protein JO152_13280, partial [Mycobacteriaceae bacterium]|nr:hypothetical protein [Mycobacteriaceae bacterium]
MSPIVEPTVLRGQRYTIRHVGPRAAVWPTTPNAPLTVLARKDMVARWLPVSPAPDSADFVSGSWTGRLGDAGDGTFVFPNANSSDGTPWRNRFDTTSHLQFLEVYDNNELDFCGVIDQVKVDQQSVTVHCSDGWFLLKKAYERDWVTIGSPRDVIDRGTRVWQPLLVDDFPYEGVSNPSAQWTTSSQVQAGPNNASVGANDSAFNPGGYTATTPWVNPNNISVGSAATFSVTAPAPPGGLGSYGLRATGFGFSIPAESTILGIQVGAETEASGANGSINGELPQLVVNGAVTSYFPSGTSFSGSFFNLGSPGWGYYGGPTESWQGGVQTLTPALVNAANFGVEYQFALNPNSGSMTASVFRVQLTIWYMSTTAVVMRQTGGVTLNVTATNGNTASL